MKKNVLHCRSWLIRCRDYHKNRKTTPYWFDGNADEFIVWITKRIEQIR